MAPACKPKQLRASVSKGEKTKVGFYNLLPLLRWTQYLIPHRMQNCKKIVLIQYQNLHKCSVKRPVSLAWPLHTQGAGTSTGDTAVHTYRDRNTTIEIELCKQYRGENNLGREQIHRTTQEGNGSKQKAGSCTSNSRRSSEREISQESNAGSEALHWMVPSENNNRNQQNYCCKWIHFFWRQIADLHHTPI